MINGARITGRRRPYPKKLLPSGFGSVRIFHTSPFALDAVAGGTFAVGAEDFFGFDRSGAGRG
jgi:hypothetical protein